MSDSYVPDNVLLKIIARVADRDFRDLGCFLLAGRRTKSIVYKNEILEKANVTEFIFHGHLIKPGSSLRNFHLGCVANGNDTGCMMEGLRIAYNHGDLSSAIEAVQKTETPGALTVYVLGMLWICAGPYILGIELLKRLRWWTDVNKFNIIGAAIEQAIKVFNSPQKWKFQKTCYCPKPDCGCKGEEFGGCPDCCVYYNAKQMMALS